MKRVADFILFYKPTIMIVNPPVVLRSRKEGRKEGKREGGRKRGRKEGRKERKE